MPVLGRFVVVRPLQVVGKVLLGGHVMGIIVGVQVALPVPQRLRSGIVSVTQVLGHRSPTPLSNVREGAIDRQVRRVGLGRSRHSHDRLGEEQARLGHADESHALRDRNARRQHLRRRHADLLRGRDHDAPRNEAGVFPRFNHPREVMEGRVHV